jgi:hypothetical protein
LGRLFCVSGETAPTGAVQGRLATALLMKPSQFAWSFLFGEAQRLRQQLEEIEMTVDMKEVLDLERRWFRVVTDVKGSREVKVEWHGWPQSGAHVLLSTDDARELAAKLRRAVELPLGSSFRESVFDVRQDDELCVFVKPRCASVFLCLGNCGYEEARFEELGRFASSDVELFAAALEDAASALKSHRR